jgi:hypothetical protein
VVIKLVFGSLGTLRLGNIVLDMEEKTVFLDPILIALAPVPGEPLGRLSDVVLSCVKGASDGASVITGGTWHFLFRTTNRNALLFLSSPRESRPERQSLQSH